MQLAAQREDADVLGAGGLSLVEVGGAGEAGDVHAGRRGVGGGGRGEQRGGQEGNEREASHHGPHRRIGRGS